MFHQSNICSCLVCEPFDSHIPCNPTDCLSPMPCHALVNPGPVVAGHRTRTYQLHVRSTGRRSTWLSILHRLLYPEAPQWSNPMAERGFIHNQTKFVSYYIHYSCLLCDLFSRECTAIRIMILHTRGHTAKDRLQSSWHVLAQASMDPADCRSSIPPRPR